MKVIVDNSVWSLALRRGQTPSDSHTVLFRELLADGRVALLGAIRQEILSGIRHAEQFERLKTYMRAFPDLELVMEDYELAAEYFNTCRNKGIQGANTDFLICAAATRRGFELLTTDKDFTSFGHHIPLLLAEP